MDSGQIFNWEQMNMKCKEWFIRNKYSRQRCVYERYSIMMTLSINGSQESVRVRYRTSDERTTDRMLTIFYRFWILIRHTSLYRSFTALPHRPGVVIFSGMISKLEPKRDIFRFSNNVGLLRKVLWLMFTVTGLFYSIRTIQTNWTRYLTYPSSIKPAYDANEAIKFPKGFKEYFEYVLKNI